MVVVHFLLDDGWKIVRNKEMVVDVFPEGAKTVLPLHEVTHFKTLIWGNEVLVEFYKGSTPLAAFNLGSLGYSEFVEVIKRLEELMVYSKRDMWDRRDQSVNVRNHTIKGILSRVRR